ncbi:2-oxo acid dehydrogenase subunit E2 [bacterium]|jgi:pyruvate dehydrogenase E2 component (dihydrolipoamide acetyltransferase)|nr:2-oxo acid dehydrogenase subunit E2 [bacterium]
MHLKLPELGEGVHEGELVKWRVKPGDTVKDDQVVCEIMTDKATVELPAPFHGKVTALLAKEGEMIKVGQEILSYEGGAVAAASASPSLSASSNGASKPAPAPAMSAAPASKPASAPAVSAAAVGGPVAAAPSTRKFARESGVELGRVAGTGPAGRVMREDVEKFIGAGAVAAGPAMVPSRGTPMRAPSVGGHTEERVPFRGLRKKISEKMRQSKDHAAHFTYVEEADVTELVKLRLAAKEIGQAQGVKVTFVPFVMKAMVAALKKYPILNSSLDEEKGELVYKHYYNIGLSVQTEDGLTAPVIKDVDHKSILEVARDVQELAEKARNKRLQMDDLKDGTITLTNAGTIGGLFATPIINYPEVAILGLNKIFKKPVVKTINGKDEIVIRDWTYFSISLDHRVVDGAVGAEFMKLFIQYIENPALLVLESL